MKKKIIILGLLLLLGLILLLFFSKKIYTVEVSVKAPLLHVQDEISFIDKIATWYSLQSGSKPIISDNSFYYNTDTVTIDKLKALSTILKISSSTKSELVQYSISEDTANHQKIKLSYNSSIFNEMIKKNELIKNANKNLLNLKDLLENTTLVYGYKIKTTLVVDTTFLFTAITVPLKEKYTAITKLYNSLKTTAESYDAGYNGVNIFYLTMVGNDSVRLYTGIGIAKNTMTIPVTGVFSLKRMPYLKNLIEGDYEGTFQNLPKFFDALEKYRSDNGMTSMAIPFVKLYGNQFNFSDTTKLNTTGYFPIL